MTSILSWNIQNGIGCDGKLSLARIADVIKSMGSADVLCLQEVSVNLLLPDASHDDQVQSLTKLFPGYQPFFGAAIDRLNPLNNEREQFGNLVLSRLPIHTVFHHPLPQPAHPDVIQMPRQMVEVNVLTATQTLRVMTTHLEYHSVVQRCAQTQRILEIQDELLQLSTFEPIHDEHGPYAKLSRGGSCVICGDFNFLPYSEQYQLLTDTSEGMQNLIDAWPNRYPNKPHPPTCGIYDSEQWEQGPHCRDFLFISPDLRKQVVDVWVNIKTDTSDHQPIKLELDI